MAEKRDLSKAVEIYHALEVCCSEAMEAAPKRNDTKFADKLSFRTERKTGDPPYTKRELKDLFDNHVVPILDEICFIDLVRVFEQVVFDLVDNASGRIRSVVKKSKEKYPFHLCSEKFVKSPTNRDISNLGHVHDILEGKISPDLHKKLGQIVDYRNWLTHGNRFKGKKPVSPGSLPEVLDILEEVLTKIRPVS